MNQEEPLWMPPGSVRSLIVMGLTGLIGYMATNDIVIPEWLIASVGSAWGYYFGTRSTQVANDRKSPVSLEEVEAALRTIESEVPLP